MISQSNIKKIYNKKIDELIKTKWIRHLNRDWIINEKTLFHQTENKNINSMDDVIKKIQKHWTNIEIMEFSKICSEIGGDIPGPHNEFHMVLVVLYQITQGLSFEELNNIIKKSTFKRVFL